MKRLYKHSLLMFILGGLFFSTFTAYATYAILSSGVSYQPNDSSWNVDNVEAALDDLYNSLGTNGGSCSGFIGMNWTFGYTGNYGVFTAPGSGEYKVELWGASGGTHSYNGKGGYTSGILYIPEGTTFYIYVGQMSDGASATYNGGGSCSTSCTSGGGATDIRYFGNTEPSSSDLAWNSELGLNSRVMVAAGGGGWNSYSSGSTGGYGGGLQGRKGYGRGVDNGPYGGSQLTGGDVNNTTASQCGTNGRFGIAGNGGNYGGGGGGGYYGGAGGSNAPSTGGGETGGGGGSSYISGHTGCIAITSSTNRSPRKGTDDAECAEGTTDNRCSIHYSEVYFNNTVMIDGGGYSWSNVVGNQVGMPDLAGTGTMNGNNGNGYAKITFVG